MYYAQVDNKGVVVGISELKGEIDDPNYIEIAENDPALQYALYDKTNGTFTKRPLPSSTVLPLVERVTAVEDMLLILMNK